MKKLKNLPCYEQHHFALSINIS